MTFRDLIDLSRPGIQTVQWWDLFITVSIQKGATIMHSNNYSIVPCICFWFLRQGRGVKINIHLFLPTPNSKDSQGFQQWDGQLVPDFSFSLAEHHKNLGLSRSWIGIYIGKIYQCPNHNLDLLFCFTSQSEGDNL